LSRSRGSLFDITASLQGEKWRFSAGYAKVSTVQAIIMQFKSISQFFGVVNTFLKKYLKKITILPNSSKKQGRERRSEKNHPYLYL
jgi:hypothetical protein